MEERDLLGQEDFFLCRKVVPIRYGGREPTSVPMSSFPLLQGQGRHCLRDKQGSLAIQY